MLSEECFLKWPFQYVDFLTRLRCTQQPYFFFTFFFIEFLDLCYSKYINDAYYNPNASIDHVQGKL